MGRIVAISSGDLESTKAINEYAVKMLNTTSPNVLFIGTASNDADEYIEKFTGIFSQMDCKVKSLQLATKIYNDEEIKDIVFWADIIYVGGGDTIFMMNIWKKYGLDTILKEVYKKDTAILMGISAGAICWFHCGCTDSELTMESNTAFVEENGKIYYIKCNEEAKAYMIRHENGVLKKEEIRIRHIR